MFVKIYMQIMFDSASYLYSIKIFRFSIQFLKANLVYFTCINISYFYILFIFLNRLIQLHYCVLSPPE